MESSRPRRRRMLSRRIRTRSRRLLGSATLGPLSKGDPAGAVGATGTACYQLGNEGGPWIARTDLSLAAPTRKWAGGLEELLSPFRQYEQGLVS